MRRVLRRSRRMRARRRGGGSARTSSTGGCAECAFDGQGVDVHLHFVLFGGFGDFGGGDVVGFVVDQVPAAVGVLVQAIDEAAEVTAVAASCRPAARRAGTRLRGGRPWRRRFASARRAAESLEHLGGLVDGARCIRDDTLGGQLFAPAGAMACLPRKSMRASTSWTSVPKASGSSCIAGRRRRRDSSSPRSGRTSWPVRREKENCRRAAASTRNRADFGRDCCRRPGRPDRGLLRAVSTRSGPRLRPIGLWSVCGIGVVTRTCGVA